MYAVEQGHTAVVSLLLEKGADVNRSQKVRHTVHRCDTDTLCYCCVIVFVVILETTYKV